MVVFRHEPYSAIPLLVLAGGGYQRDWRALIPLHRIVFEEAARIAAARGNRGASAPGDPGSRLRNATSRRLPP